jgi:predicted AAA+ superfamily ATPase
VIKEGADVVRLIQVCYDIDNSKTKERELKSLVKAAGELDCRDLLVITWDREDKEEFKGCDIRFVPLWKWLQG